MLPSLGGETDTPRHSLFRTAHRLAAQRNDGNRTQCEASTQDARRLGGLQGKRGTSVELPRVDSIAASRATYRPFPPGQLNFILEEDYFYVAQNQKKYLYEEVSKVWYNNEVFNKGGVKYPEFTFHVYLSSGMALKHLT